MRDLVEGSPPAQAEDSRPGRRAAPRPVLPMVCPRAREVACRPGRVAGCLLDPEAASRPVPEVACRRVQAGASRPAREADYLRGRVVASRRAQKRPTGTNQPPMALFIRELRKRGMGHVADTLSRAHGIR